MNTQRRTPVRAPRAWPLIDRFPALGCLRRASLRSGPTPIETIEGNSRLRIKRDDLTALPIGGNKVRSLEFLLGDVQPNDEIITVGSIGSTHALSTALHARRLGARTRVARWPQEMNPVAERVASELSSAAECLAFPNAPLALAWAWWKRVRGTPVVPAGGTSALGALGHVNAAFEFAEQIRNGEAEVPEFIVVPLGTGGTAAGLSLGLGLAGVPSTVIAVRVVPKIVGRAARIRRIAAATAALIEKVDGEPIPESAMAPIRVIDDAYGGAYGRPLARATAASERLSAHGITLDATYSAKAFVVAEELSRTANTLFWLTFDSRWMKQGS